MCCLEMAGGMVYDVCILALFSFFNEMNVKVFHDVRKCVIK